MNTQTQKALVLEQFKQVNDIHLINAIKNMLDFAIPLTKTENNNAIPESQKIIVRQRLKKMDVQPETCMTWEDIENKIIF